MKKVLILAVAILLVASTAFPQGFAVGKKAMILSGTVEFASYSGDSYKNDEGKDASETTIAFLPALDYFVANNIFVGGTLQYLSNSQDPASSTTLGIGPEVGYAFGKAESKMFPYGKLALLYQSSSVDPGTTGSETYKMTGSDIALAVGILLPVQQHIGIIPELSYHAISSKGDWDNAENMSDSAIRLGVGIVGLWWK